MGAKLSAVGIQPDPEKVRAITDMSPAKDKISLQRALSLVNYVGKFIPNFLAKIKALRSLLENKTKWKWEHYHEAEWEMMKKSLTKDPELKFYDPSLPVKCPPTH